MTHYIGPETKAKKKRPPRPGTPLMEVARRRLPETKEWLKKTHPRGTIITRATIREKSPGMDGRSWTTREATSFCVCRLLIEDKSIVKIGQGTYRVVFAL